MQNDAHANQDLLTLLHLDENPANNFHAVAPPLVMTSLHVFEDLQSHVNFNAAQPNEYIYGRVANPTVTLLENKLAALENGQAAVVFSSGMAASTAVILSTCPAGSHIIALNNIYSPIKTFLDGYGKEFMQYSTTYVRGTDITDFEQAIRPDTTLILIESPSTFLFSLVDIRRLASLAQSRNITTYMDNTCATPLYQKPLDMGIDIVMHSLTKYIGGHSDILGGCLISNNTDYIARVKKTIREALGSIIGPMEAWLALRGMRTLALRVKQHGETALAVARFLEHHPRVKQIYYPGLASHPQFALMQTQQSGNTGLIGFDFAGTTEELHSFCNSLRCFQIGHSWGGYESLVTVPLYHCSEETCAFYGVGTQYVRLHCGLEGTDNLIQDLTQAFAGIPAPTL